MMLTAQASYDGDMARSPDHDAVCGSRKCYLYFRFLNADTSLPRV
jgi:hypothetical protein